MAEISLYNLLSFLNRRFWRNQTIFEKKPLFAYLLGDMLLRAKLVLRSCANSAALLKVMRKEKAQQSVSGSLSSCTSIACDVISRDSRRAGEVDFFTTLGEQQHDRIQRKHPVTRTVPKAAARSG